MLQLSAFRHLIAAAGLLYAGAAAAIDPDRTVADCVEDAARVFDVPRMLIRLVLDVEGGKVGMASPNTNGTFDLGPMQINTWWLQERVSGRTLADFGLTRDELQNNVCINIYAGTWILARLMASHGREDLAGVLAHYHSPTPVHQARYLGRVLQIVDRRLASLEVASTAVLSERPVR